MRGRPILLLLVWLQTELDSTQSYHHYLQRQATNNQENSHNFKRSTELTYSDFPCHFKVNRDKLALTQYRRWKCKKGKRLTVTANFKEQNLGMVGKNSDSWAE